MDPSAQLPYCLMPWIHLHVGDHGTVKACCVANIPFGNINTDTVEEIWQGESIQRLREKFANGISDKRCAKCINVEQAGGQSIRLETLEKYADSNWQKQTLPFYFDIRFSNVCNFRCRTCWHGASSKWFQDAKQLGRTAAKKAIIKNISDFENFIHKYGPALRQAKEIYIAGGEPLVTEEHYLLLEWLIEAGNTNVPLRYNTNFSTLSFKTFDALKLWSHFSNIELMASLDGSEKLGEYIRKEMNWEVILKNREKIKILNQIKFKVAPTVSVLNMFHLPDFYQQLLALNFIQPKEIYLNILERPNYYNIQIFPEQEKEKITGKYQLFFEWLKKEGLPKSVQEKFQPILQYLWNKDQSQYWDKYQSESRALDELRQETMPLNITD